MYNETAPAGKEARQKVGAHRGVCQSSGTHLRQGSCVLSKITFEALFYILAVLRMHWHRFSRGLFVTDVDSVSFYGVGVFFLVNSFSFACLLPRVTVMERDDDQCTYFISFKIVGDIKNKSLGCSFRYKVQSTVSMAPVNKQASKIIFSSQSAGERAFCHFLV